MAGHLDFRRPLADPQGLAILAVALAIYGVATLLWVAVLRNAPLSRIYPIMALSFVLTPLGGMVFLKEPISAPYWAGVMLIGLLANREYLKWFPTSGLHDPIALSMPFLPHHTPGGWERGWLLDSAWHLVLPIVCLSYGGSAFRRRPRDAHTREVATLRLKRELRSSGETTGQYLLQLNDVTW